MRKVSYSIHVRLGRVARLSVQEDILSTRSSQGNGVGSTTTVDNAAMNAALNCIIGGTTVDVDGSRAASDRGINGQFAGSSTAVDGQFCSNSVRQFRDGEILIAGDGDVLEIGIGIQRSNRVRAIRIAIRHKVEMFYQIDGQSSTGRTAELDTSGSRRGTVIKHNGVRIILGIHSQGNGQRFFISHIARYGRGSIVEDIAEGNVGRGSTDAITFDTCNERGIKYLVGRGRQFQHFKAGKDSTMSEIRNIRSVGED